MLWICPDVNLPYPMAASMPLKIDFCYSQNLERCSCKLAAISKLLFKGRESYGSNSLMSSRYVKTVIVVGAQHMISIIKSYLAHRSVPYVHFDEYEGDDAPQQIVKEWLSKCIRFNFDSNINVGIICATNLGVCASLTSFHGVEQVIFTDTIEVDSELPEGQSTFVKHLAEIAKPAKLKVARLCSSGTIEETFLRSKDADAALA